MLRGRPRRLLLPLLSFVGQACWTPLARLYIAFGLLKLTWWPSQVLHHLLSVWLEVCWSTFFQACQASFQEVRACSSSSWDYASACYIHGRSEPLLSPCQPDMASCVLWPTQALRHSVQWVWQPCCCSQGQLRRGRGVHRVLTTTSLSRTFSAWVNTHGLCPEVLKPWSIHRALDT